MALKTYNITFNPAPGSAGSLIEYKLAADSTWITPSVPDNPTTLGTFPLDLEEGNTYHVRVSPYNPSGECTSRPTIISVAVPSGAGVCCNAGYTASPDGTYCYKIETSAPTVDQSDICLAISQLTGQYSSSGSKVYDPGYDVHLNTGATTYTLLTTSYWKETTPTGLTGPMNREGVWVDTDCEGTKDPLTIGSVLQLSTTISTPVAKTVYVGMGGDNTFELVLNGVQIVKCTNLSGEEAGLNAADNFNFWHIIPIDLVSGPNQLTFKSIGDGSTNDCFAAVVYDNTAGQLATATADGDLTILYHTATYRGQHIDIATCPSGWDLDTSGGQGSYVCKRILTDTTVPC